MNEQRRVTRVVPADTSTGRVRIRAGREARVFNYSIHGVYMASTMRLLPGRRCVLAWPELSGVPAAEGVVVRCAVGRLDPDEGVTYHAAVAFDQPTAFLRELATHAG